MSAKINDVTDTALWVAVYRARETERSQPLFRDPLARKLAGERGPSIEKAMHDSNYVEWSVVMRTCIIDEYIMTLVGEGLDCVVNLGAGLDTRPYRMELPKTLRWIEVDFPNIINLKNERLASEVPRCRLERIALDLAKESERSTLFAKINAESKNVLVLTEGVTPYLSNADVASLAKGLREQSHFKHFIADYNSRELIKRVRHRRRKQMRNAPFLFDPPDWTNFYADLGWKVRAMKYLGEEASRLGRPAPHPWSMRALLSIMSAKKKEKLLRMNGYALLEPIS